MASRRKNPLYGDNYYEGTGMQDMRYIPKYLLTFIQFSLWTKMTNRATIIGFNKSKVGLNRSANIKIMIAHTIIFL